MGNQQSAINTIGIFQDIEFNDAYGKLINEQGGNLASFIVQQQDNIRNSVQSQKDAAITKLYGDLDQSIKNQDSILLMNNNYKAIKDIYTDVYNNQQKTIDTIANDKSVNGRKYEMNEWSVGNKQETLFIYSMLFVALCTTTLLVLMRKIGIINTGLMSILILLLVLIVIFTVIYRRNYTNYLRDRRYWNRKKFRPETGPQIPNICDISSDDVQKAYDDKINDLNNLYKNVQSSLSRFF